MRARLDFRDLDNVDDQVEYAEWFAAGRADRRAGGEPRPLAGRSHVAESGYRAGWADPDVELAGGAS